MAYADVAIRIRKQDNGRYPVEITVDGQREFPRGSLDAAAQPPSPSDAHYADAVYGQALFNWFFADRQLGENWSEIRGAYPRRRVRLHIDLDEPALHQVNWEALCEPQKEKLPELHLAASSATPFSRYLPGKHPHGTPIIRRPIRFLVVAPAQVDFEEKYPTGQYPGMAHIDPDKEFQALERALKPLVDQKLVTLTLLPQPCSLAAIAKELMQGYHVLHLICHGQYSSKTQSARLLLADTHNRVRPEQDEDIKSSLGQQFTEAGVEAEDRLRLIFLASCESAKRSSADAYRGLAPRLVDAGAPAVIAMQDQVGEQTAREFAAAFYTRLLEHGQVDLAANEARQIIMAARLSGPVIPVLFLRLRDGRLFAQPETGPARRRLQSPPPPATFTGRVEVLGRLSQALKSQPDAQVTVALQGIGGQGKSTVARKLGRDLEDAFPGGVLWVDVGPGAAAGNGAGHDDIALASQQGLIVSRIALELGLDLKDMPRLEDQAALVRRELAAGGRLLAILDDVWDADLGRWLMQALLPGRRAVLITTRLLDVARALAGTVERLGVLSADEGAELLARFLGPLERQSRIREAGVPSGPSYANEDTDLRAPSRGFADREKYLTDALGRHEATARQIVGELDGLPLALELAARRCDEGADDLPWLLGQLRSKPTLGVLTLPGQVSRETSLEYTLSLSLQGLDEELVRRFRALGVFAPAPFDLAALAAVWQDEDLDLAEQAARQLVRRALLQRGEERLPGGAAPAHPVYAHHALLRVYALALAAGEAQAAAGRQAEYFKALPGQGWQQGELYWPQVEHAWRRVDEGTLDERLDFLYTVKDFAYLRGLWESVRRRAEELLAELQASTERPGDQADLLGNLGFIANALGDKRQALVFYEQALLRRQGGDKAGEARTLNNIGKVHDDLGDKRQALTFYEQALALRRQVGDKRGEAVTLNNIGTMHSDLGDKRQALTFYEQALPLWRQVGDKAGEASTLNNIGAVHDDLGDKRQALTFYEQALALRRQVGDKRGEASTLNNIGTMHSDLGDKRQALTFFEQALPLLRQVGDKASEAVICFNMAVIYIGLGDLAQAERLLMRTVELDEAVGHPDLESDRAALERVRAMRQGQPGRAGGADAGEDDSSEQRS